MSNDYSSLFRTIVTIFQYIYDTGVYIFGLLNSTIGELIEDTGISGFFQVLIPNNIRELTVIQVLFGSVLVFLLLAAIIKFFAQTSPI